MSAHVVEYVSLMTAPARVRTRGMGDDPLWDWQAQCACGWKGPQRIAESFAYSDGRRHLEVEAVTS